MIEEISKVLAKEIKDIRKNYIPHNIKLESTEKYDCYFLDAFGDEYSEKHHVALYSIYIRLINFHNALTGEDKDNLYKEVTERVNEILKTKFSKIDLGYRVNIKPRTMIAKLYLCK